MDPFSTCDPVLRATISKNKTMTEGSAPVCPLLLQPYKIDSVNQLSPQDAHPDCKERHTIRKHAVQSGLTNVQIL